MNKKLGNFLIGALEGWNKFLDGFLLGIGFILAIQVVLLVVQ